MLKTLKAYLKAPVLYILVFSFSINVLSLIAPLYSMQVFDRVISSGNINTLIYLTLIAVVLTIAMGVFSYVRTSVQFYIADCFSRAVKPYLLALHLNGHILQDGILQSMSYAERIRQFLIGQSFSILLDIPFVPVFAIALYYIHPVLLLISVVGCILLLCISCFNEYQNKNNQKSMTSRVTLHSQYTQSMIIAIDTLRALRIQNNVFSQWAKSEEALSASVEEAHFGNKIYFEISKTIRIIVQLFVTAATGYYIVYGEMNAGALMAASILAGKVISPFEQIIGVWNIMIQTRHAYEQLSDSLSVEMAEHNIEIGPIAGHITVTDMFYKPHDDAAVDLLHDINFKLNAGECLVILGPSGSGKSTLLKCLAGIYKPTHGSVRIDGAEISQQFGSIGKSIGFMGQNNDFLPATIKMNIARMDDNVSDAAIVQAAKNAGAHEMILSLPKGYETLMGYGSSPLSSGQQQKIALARALMGSPSVLFLDEPNAHLDHEGEARLTNLLYHLKTHNVTCVIVSHRPSILKVADKCAIIQNGKLVQFCSVDVLLKNNQTQISKNTDTIQSIPQQPSE